jgi:hypothetical protein
MMPQSEENTLMASAKEQGHRIAKGLKDSETKQVSYCIILVGFLVNMHPHLEEVSATLWFDFYIL